MPPTPSRLYDLILACGFTPPQLNSITQTSMGVGLSEISPFTEPAARARAIVDFAEGYGLIAPLTATILSAGADKPALQNLLLDDNMSLEDGRAAQSTALDLVRLESKVDRQFDRMDSKMEATLLEVRNALAEVRNVLTELRALRMDSGRQPIALSGKAIVFLIVTLAALAIGQISLLAWVGALPHG